MPVGGAGHEGISRGYVSWAGGRAVSGQSCRRWACTSKAKGGERLRSSGWPRNKTTKTRQGRRGRRGLGGGRGRGKDGYRERQRQGGEKEGSEGERAAVVNKISRRRRAPPQCSTREAVEQRPHARASSTLPKQARIAAPPTPKVPNAAPGLAERPVHDYRWATTGARGPHLGAH